MKLYPLICLVLLSSTAVCQKFRSDSTLREVKDPVYHQGRQAIIKPFKAIRDSIWNSQPKWRDSLKMTLLKDTTNQLVKNYYIYFKNKWEAEREIMRSKWCPFAQQLEIYNRTYRVVGDMKAQCNLKTEQ